MHRVAVAQMHQFVSNCDTHGRKITVIDVNCWEDYLLGFPIRNTQIPLKVTTISTQFLAVQLFSHGQNEIQACSNTEISFTLYFPCFCNFQV